MTGSITKLLFPSFKPGHFQVLVQQLLKQVYFTFIASIHINIVLGFFAGLMLATQSQLGFQLLGQKESLGEMLVFILLREIAPLSALLLMIARSVTAVASEIATMKVGSEIEALEVLGIDARQYLWAPRILAGGISLFCMSLLFWIISLFGVWLGANISGRFPLPQILSSVTNTLSIADIVFYTLKTTVPGLMIFHMAYRHGEKILASSHMVPVATNSAVVDTLTWGFGFHILVSGLFYLYFGF